MKQKCGQHRGELRESPNRERQRKSCSEMWNPQDSPRSFHPRQGMLHPKGTVAVHESQLSLWGCATVQVNKEQEFCLAKKIFWIRWLNFK